MLIDIIKNTKCPEEEIPTGVSSLETIAKELGITKEEALCKCNQAISEGTVEKISFQKGSKTYIAFKEIVKVESKKK